MVILGVRYLTVKEGSTKMERERERINSDC